MGQSSHVVHGEALRLCTMPFGRGKLLQKGNNKDMRRSSQRQLTPQIPHPEELQAISVPKLLCQSVAGALIEQHMAEQRLTEMCETTQLKMFLSKLLPTWFIASTRSSSAPRAKTLPQCKSRLADLAANAPLILSANTATRKRSLQIS